MVGNTLNVGLLALVVWEGLLEGGRVWHCAVRTDTVVCESGLWYSLEGSRHNRSVVYIRYRSR